MKNIRMAVKLIGSFTIIAAIILVVGVIGWNGSRQLETALREIGEIRLPAVEALLATEVEIEEMLVAQRTLMAEFLPLQERRRQLEHFTESRSTMVQTWERFKTLPAPREIELMIERFDRENAEWQELNDQWLAELRSFEARDLLNPAELVATLYEARGDYYAIKVDVLEYLRAGESFDGGEEASDTALGRWLAEFETENPEMQRIADAMIAPQNDFHSAVRTINELLQEGNLDEALLVYDETLVPAEESLFDLL